MQDLDADCIDIGVHIGLSAGHPHCAHRRMRQQRARDVVDQSFLQVDVALLDPMADRQADEVVVNHFVDSVMPRSGDREWDVQIDVERETLCTLFFDRMDANVGIDDQVADKEPPAVRQPRVEQAALS